MISEPLNLTHRELLQPLLRAAGAGLSEYSFANLYLFREKHDYRVIPEAPFFVTGKSYSGDPFAMPTGDARLIDRELIDRMIGRCGCLFPVPEHWLTAFPPDGYEITHDDAESDYIHAITRLAEYSGSKLHAKKNLVNQFLRDYQVEALPLTNDRLGDAMRILDQWASSGSDLPPDLTDYGPCSEAIALYEKLVLCGAIYYVDSAPAGFIIGEELDDETFVLHFAKADRRIKGIYQYMYRQFAAIMPARYALFNLEQDLGLDPLRKTKASYDPDRMGIKYRIKKVNS